MGKVDENLMKFKNSKNNNLYDPIIIRSHNFIFKLDILRKPQNLERKLENSSWLEAVYLKNWRYWKGDLQVFGISAFIVIKPNVIQIFLPEIYGLHPSDNLFTAYINLLKVKTFLEKQFKGLYLLPNRMSLRMIESSGIHHAWIHHSLSLKAKQQNISLKFANWEIDASNGFPELESINPFQSDLHLVKELEDYEYRSRNKIYFKDLHFLIKQLKKNPQYPIIPDYSSFVSAS